MEMSRWWHCRKNLCLGFPQDWVTNGALEDSCGTLWFRSLISLCYWIAYAYPMLILCLSYAYPMLILCCYRSHCLLSEWWTNLSLVDWFFDRKMKWYSGNEQMLYGQMSLCFIGSQMTPKSRKVARYLKISWRFISSKKNSALFKIFFLMLSDKSKFRWEELEVAHAMQDVFNLSSPEMMQFT